jgi:hypothetical protein
MNQFYFDFIFNYAYKDVINLSWKAFSPNLDDFYLFNLINFYFYSGVDLSIFNIF